MKLRHPEKNEFFFTTHSNIGECEEFVRFVKYINENSIIKFSVPVSKSTIIAITRNEDNEIKSEKIITKL